MYIYMCVYIYIYIYLLGILFVLKYTVVHFPFQLLTKE